jgi:hypothetical protein
MARVKLSRRECKQDLLPPVCVLCGAPATVRRPRRFSWFPGWIWIIVILSWLIGLILAIVLTKSMTVPLPACDQHEGYWRRKKHIVNIGSVVVLLLCGAAFVFLLAQDRDRQSELAGWICGGGAAVFFLWLLVALVIQSGRVRASEITDKSIILFGVHPEFVNALEDDRERDRQEYEAEGRELRELLRERRARREREDAASESEQRDDFRPRRTGDALGRQPRDRLRPDAGESPDDDHWPPRD